MPRLEHANLSVRDADAATRFLQAAFPHFRVRGEGLDDGGRAWRHVGDERFYVALQSVPAGEVRTPYGDTPGLNHLGWEVESVDALEARMNAAGFRANLRFEQAPARRRIYFHDPDGNDWEFVEYLSGELPVRNDYSIA